MDGFEDWRSATTAARAFDRTTTRPRSATSRSSARRAFHYEPETNGCVEKFIQTLKEQVLWIERFETLDELRAAVRAFAVTYNREWLIERHGYRSPLEARELMLAAVA